jgi:hypothetical protein
MIDLSIVIVSFNTAGATLACLSSIFTHTRAIAFEVIVVDNASNDETTSWIKQRFPTVNLMENRENVGFATASNQGIRAARGRYLMLLNSDTELTDDSLSGLVRALDNHPNIGAAGPRLIYPDGRTQHWSACRRKTLLSTVKPYAVIQGSSPPLYLRGRCHRAAGTLAQPDCSPLYETESVSGAAMIVRREVADSVGLLDEGFFLYCEDSDWMTRIRNAGFIVACAPDVTIIHHHGMSSRQDETAREVTATMSNIRYLAKHHGGAEAFFFRLAILCLMTLRMISLDLYRALFIGNQTKLKTDWAVLKCALTYRVQGLR